MNIKFVKEYLTNIKWQNNKSWQVEGHIKKLSNQYYKFDIRHLSDFADKKGKLINSKNKSDKVLFEDDQNWILVDTQELIKYMRDHSLKEVKLEELIKNIEWNIILPKK
jgi:hypothetical protein